MSTIREETDFGSELTQEKGGGIDLGYTAEGGKVGKLRYQNHFDYLYHRGSISNKQWIAGDRLKMDGYRAGKMAYVRSSADFSVRGNTPDSPAEFIIKAKENFRTALSLMTSEEIKIINLYVIDDGYYKNPTTKQRIHNMENLRNGLDILIKYYHI